MQYHDILLLYINMDKLILTFIVKFVIIIIFAVADHEWAVIGHVVCYNNLQRKLNLATLVGCLLTTAYYYSVLDW